MGYIADKEYQIHYYEIDYKKRCLITSLLNYFQDLAILQSDLQGAGIDYLAEHQLAWVLYRWDVKVHRYPMYREKIKIRTYAYSFVKFYAFRKFEVADESGNIIASADTVWFLVNTDNKKPVKINSHMYQAYGVSFEENDPIEFDNLEEMTEAEIQHDYEVRYSDIDTNRHVNNVKYVDWALETIPLKTVGECDLVRLKAIYQREATYGNSVKVYTQIFPGDHKLICRHRIVGCGDKDLCQLETTWAKR